MLGASMGAIYQRFGYGRGSEAVQYNVDTRFMALRQPFAWDVDVRLIDQSSAEDRAVAERVYDEWAVPRNLLPIRDARRWEYLW